MTLTLAFLISALVIIFCVLLNTASFKIGIPMLLTFIVLGMIFGSDGIIKIPFENYEFAEDICSAALIFIMFYGGFGTNWEQAKPVAVKSALLSTVGVIFTAGLTGLFCHYILHIAFWESFLIGAVVSSTDAASVFSILRSKKLGLKNNTDSMLELESGSNDPCSYMLTILVLSIMSGGISPGSIILMVISQFAFGLIAGAVIALAAAFVLRHFTFSTDGFDMAFVIGIALLAFAGASLLGGNGYLSAYICGIILGNLKIKNKKALVHFFDGITGLMQMLIFFLLGLLATPSKIPSIFLVAVGIMLFLTFVARPLSVFSILSPFRSNVRQQLLVSFAGLRGAASIVFAIMATVSPSEFSSDLFHIVFCIVLLSITFQGSLLAPFAKKLKMSDGNIDVMKTFNDYSEKVDLEFIEVKINEHHPWADHDICDITLPPDTLIVFLVRDGVREIPNGGTTLLKNDTVVLGAHRSDIYGVFHLQEYQISRTSKWIGKSVQEFSPEPDELVIMLIRDKKALIPNGNTVIAENDILVVNSDSGLA